MCNTKFERDAYFLGAILTNLLTLEYRMRCYIAVEEGYDCSQVHVKDLQKGYIIPNAPNALKIKYFSDVLKHFNQLVEEEDKIDKRLINIRNSFAHGEIIGDMENITDIKDVKDGIVKLVKFDRQNAKIENVYEMTDDWLEKIKDDTAKAIEKVGKLLRIHDVLISV